MEIDGIRMLIGLVIGITLLIMLVLKTKVQTFLALIISTIQMLWMPQVMPGQASVSSIPSQAVLAERWEALESSSDSAL